MRHKTCSEMKQWVECVAVRDAGSNLRVTASRLALSFEVGIRAVGHEIRCVSQNWSKYSPKMILVISKCKSGHSQRLTILKSD